MDSGPLCNEGVGGLKYKIDGKNREILVINLCYGFPGEADEIGRKKTGTFN
ncbi:MAG: hypothetical protein GX329_01710 [Tissierellia bacterium]|nr:hypothetical protein [Tissierellia bacterium]